MTTLEEEVRAAIRARAEEITPASIRPLRLPPPASRCQAGIAEPRPPRPLHPPHRPHPETRGRPGSGRDRGRRRIIPLVAAAAVIAVLTVVMVAIGRPDTGRTPATGSVSGIPAYYLALTGTKQPFPDHPQEASVYASATGVRLATVTPPRPYRTFIAVTAAASDHTFVLAAQTSAARDSAGAVAFFLMRFSPGHHRARLDRLTGLQLQAGEAFVSFALSPDAQRLAVEFYLQPASLNGVTEKLLIWNRITGQKHTWSGKHDSIAIHSSRWTLSWTADSRTLAFSGGTGASAGLRLLNPAAGGRDLTTSSRLVLPYRNRRLGTFAVRLGSCADCAMLTPDGKTIVADTVSRPALNPRTHRTSVSSGFAEFSAATGAFRRFLDWRPSDPDKARLVGLWSNSSGSVLIGGHPGQLGVVRGNHVTVLPQPAGAQLDTAAW